MPEPVRKPVDSRAGWDADPLGIGSTIETVGGGALNYFLGLGKSVLGTLQGGGNLIRKIPGVAALENATGAYVDTNISTKPEGFAQGAGKLTGDVAQAVAPGAAITRTATSAARAVPAGLKTVTRAAVEGTGAASVAAMQGQDPTVAAGLGAAVPLASGLVRGAKNLIPMGRTTKPVDEALAFASREGIPVDYATRTGSPIARVIQEQTENSLGGAKAAETFRAAQSDAMMGQADKLGGRAFKETASPEMAGAGVRDALWGGVQRESGIADEAYTALRKIEEEAPERLAVDMNAVKAELKPLYEQLALEGKVAGGLLGGKGRAMVALEGLMKAPNTMPLSAVDSALGEIKALARTGEKELRSGPQGIAAQAVQSLDKAVRQAAANGPPAVMDALDAGRRATTTKYQIADVLDQFADEPVQTFKQATFRQDAGIERLRAAAKHTPDAMPKIGRAWLDDLMATATAEGKFEKGAASLKAWQDLGPETKKILFPDEALRKDLSAFFMLAKKTGEVSNTSGTAKANTLFNVGKSAITFPLSKVLFSTKARKSLLSGMANGEQAETIAQNLARILGTQAGGDE